MIQSSVLEMAGTWFFNFLLDLLIKLWLRLPFRPLLYAGSTPHPPVLISSTFNPLFPFLLSIVKLLCAEVGPIKEEFGEIVDFPLLPCPLLELLPLFILFVEPNLKLNNFDKGDIGFRAQFRPGLDWGLCSKCAS